MAKTFQLERMDSLLLGYRKYFTQINKTITTGLYNLIFQRMNFFC